MCYTVQVLKVCEPSCALSRVPQFFTSSIRERIGVLIEEFFFFSRAGCMKEAAAWEKVNPPSVSARRNNCADLNNPPSASALITLTPAI